MSAPVAGSATSADDLELLARLRRGDEAAFTQLVERLQGPMLRVAMIHVGNRAVAEEVAQDAWVGAGPAGPVRGALVAPDLGPADRRQPGQDPGRA